MECPSDLILVSWCTDQHSQLFEWSALREEGYFFCALHDSCSFSARTPWGNYQVDSVFHKARSVELASQSLFTFVLQNLSTSSHL